MSVWPTSNTPTNAPKKPPGNTPCLLSFLLSFVFNILLPYGGDNGLNTLKTTLKHPGHYANN